MGAISVEIRLSRCISFYLRLFRTFVEIQLTGFLVLSRDGDPDSDDENNRRDNTDFTELVATKRTEDFPVGEVDESECEA